MSKITRKDLKIIKKDEPDNISESNSEEDPEGINIVWEETDNNTKFKEP